MNTMRSIAVVFGLLAAVTLALTVSTGATQPQPVQKKTVLSFLKVGQSVTLKAKATGWEIGTTGDESPLTHKVSEIGGDYIVLVDETGAVETRIPVTAVGAVVNVRTKGK